MKTFLVYEDAPPAPARERSVHAIELEPGEPLSAQVDALPATVTRWSTIPLTDHPIAAIKKFLAGE